MANSALTCIELAQGCRDKAELVRLKRGLATHRTEVVPVTPALCRRAVAPIDDLDLALSHRPRLADAMIGATAIEHQAALVTANVRHFTAIDGLAVEVFIP